MKQKTPKPAAPDPEVQRQQEAARQEKIDTIQDTLSTQTDKALRYFGTRQALAGVTTSPLVSLAR